LARFSETHLVYALLGGALALPALVAFIFLAYDGYAHERAHIEREAQKAADELVLLADARVRGDLGALHLLSSTSALREREIQGAVIRAKEALSLFPGWKAIILSDRATGEIIFDVSNREVLLSGQYIVDPNPVSGSRMVGGVTRDGRHCPCAALHVSVPGEEPLVLTAIVNPWVFQSKLRAIIPEGAVAAVVDREGRFLARSLDYGRRVGTPATEYVLEAIGRGGRGTYRGRTHEGLENYSAYAVSESTGWSAHVAVDARLFDEPSSRANAVVLGGATIALVAGSALFALAVRDLANRRRETKRMVDMQRTEAMSHFTATIVHDFRNIVSAIESGMNLIARRTADEEIRSHVEMIRQSVQRGTRLANQLLSFTSPTEPALEPVDLADLLQEADYLLRRAVGPDVKLVVEEPSECCHALANRDQLELALLNLAINARDAMQGSGLLRIATEVGQHEVVLKVSDTGPGIPPAQRAAVFDPFHTTKSSGTGLGLAQVAGAVHNAGGRVQVEDAEGGGACFVLTLPRANPIEATLPRSA
jgi:signal transduction histidine kinase